MEKKKYLNNPLEGNILLGMTLFALPIMAVFLLQVFFGMADTIVIGQFGTENAMSSIGVTQSLINLIITLGIGIGTGVSVTIGRLYGEKNKDFIHKIIESLPLTALFIGCVMIVIVEPLATVLLKLTDVPDYLLSDSSLYFRIYFIGVPFQIAFTFMSSAVQAKGDTIHPLLFQSLAGLTNILLNLLTVIVFKWNVAGVAIATSVSQMASSVAIFIFLTRQKDEMHLSIKELRLFVNLKDVFKNGLPASFSNIMLDISNVLIQSAINTFSKDEIAGCTAAGSVESFMYVAFVGFGSASVVYISQNFGARNYERIKKTFITTMVSVLLLGELVGMFIYLLSTPLLSIYGVNENAIAAGKVRMLFMCTCFGLCGTMNTLNGCIKGLQYPKIAMFISMLCAGILRTIWVLIMKYTVHTLQSIYIAYPLCWGLSTILCVIFFIILYNKRKNENLRREENGI